MDNEIAKYNKEMTSKYEKTKDVVNSSLFVSIIIIQKRLRSVSSQLLTPGTPNPSWLSFFRIHYKLFLCVINFYRF